MCVSIVFAASLPGDRTEPFVQRVEELGRLYGYGIGMGPEKLVPGVQMDIIRVMYHPDVIFELHDLPEPHCACDIDQDIRIASKLEGKSRFFDFVRETMEFKNIQALSVLFFQEIMPNETTVRKQLGTYEDFVELLNRWHTWQIAGFEPTRQAYYIADESPLLFTFTDIKLTQ